MKSILEPEDRRNSLCLEALGKISQRGQLRWNWENETGGILLMEEVTGGQAGRHGGVGFLGSGK